MRWLHALVMGLFVFAPAPVFASYIFSFKSTSVTGAFPGSATIVISDEGYAAGHVFGQVDAVAFGGNTGELESLVFGPFTADPPPSNPMPVPLLRYDLTIVGNRLAGNFRAAADGGLTMAQGSGSADAWLIGVGGDGGSCSGSQD